MWLFNTGNKNLALLQLSAGHLIVWLTLTSALSFHCIAKPSSSEGDRHHSVNTKSSFHNCPFWVTGQANAHAPTSVQQHATASIKPLKWKLRSGYVSLLFCWSPLKESWGAPHMATLPESSLETAVPPWLICLVPLGSGTLSCVNVLFQSANRSC